VIPCTKRLCIQYRQPIPIVPLSCSTGMLPPTSDMGIPSPNRNSNHFSNNTNPCTTKTNPNCNHDKNSPLFNEAQNMSHDRSILNNQRSFIRHVFLILILKNYQTIKLGQEAINTNFLNITCHYDLRKCNFTNWAIPTWNSLPNQVVSAKTIKIF